MMRAFALAITWIATYTAWPGHGAVHASTKGSIKGGRRGGDEGVSRNQRRKLAIELSGRVMDLVRNGVYETHDQITPTLVEHIRKKVEGKALALAEKSTLVDEEHFKSTLQERVFIHALWNLDEVNRAIAAFTFYHHIGLLPEGFDVRDPKNWVETKDFFAMNAVASTFATRIDYKPFDKETLGVALEEKTLEHFTDLSTLYDKVAQAAEGPLETEPNRKLLAASQTYKKGLTDVLTRSIVGAGFPRRTTSQTVGAGAPTKTAKEIVSAVSIEESLPDDSLSAIEARLRSQFNMFHPHGLGRLSLDATSRNLLDDMILSRDLGDPIMEFVQTPRTAARYARDHIRATIIKAKVPVENRDQIFAILFPEFRRPIERTRQRALDMENDPQLLADSGALDFGDEESNHLTQALLKRIGQLGTTALRARKSTSRE